MTQLSRMYYSYRWQNFPSNQKQVGKDCFKEEQISINVLPGEEEEGFRSLENVKAAHIQKFLLRISKRYSLSSAYNTHLYLKKLYDFLFKRGYSVCDYRELLSSSINRERKIVPSLLKTDITKLLDSINWDTVKWTGLRDYADRNGSRPPGLRCSSTKADGHWLYAWRNPGCSV